MLCGQWNRVKRMLDHTPRILYIDTEMKRLDTLRMGRKALAMAGLPENVNPEGFVYVNMRKYTASETIERVERLIRRFMPEVVFIDGSLDLCNDFNNNTESQELIKGTYPKCIDCTENVK